MGEGDWGCGGEGGVGGWVRRGCSFTYARGGYPKHFEDVKIGVGADELLLCAAGLIAIFNGVNYL